MAKLKPFELLNEKLLDSRVLLVCDHASGALPPASFDKRVQGFIADEADLSRHIGVDIGAAAVCRAMAEILRAPAVLAGYSRLYVDLNRAIDDFTCMRAISDGSVIDGNRFLTGEDKAKREAAVFAPYHSQVDSLRGAMAERCGGAERLAVLFVHSFTPVYKGEARPWHVGVLSGATDKRLSTAFLSRWRELYPEFVIGDNEPYSGEDVYSYSIHRHAEADGHLHFGLEIRQDLIDSDAGAAEWAQRVAECLDKCLT